MIKSILLTFLLITCVFGQYDNFNIWNNYLPQDTETTIPDRTAPSAPTGFIVSNAVDTAEISVSGFTAETGEEWAIKFNTSAFTDSTTGTYIQAWTALGDTTNWQSGLYGHSISANTLFYYTLFVRDTSNNWAYKQTSQTITHYVADTSPPDTATTFAVVSVVEDSIDLTLDAMSTEADTIRILYKTGSYPTGINDGTLFLAFQVLDSATYQDQRLYLPSAGGETYYFSVFSGDTIPNWTVTPNQDTVLMKYTSQAYVSTIAADSAYNDSVGIVLTYSSALYDSAVILVDTLRTNPTDSMRFVGVVQDTSDTLYFDFEPNQVYYFRAITYYNAQTLIDTSIWDSLRYVGSAGTSEWLAYSANDLSSYPYAGAISPTGNSYSNKIYEDNTDRCNPGELGMQWTNGGGGDKNALWKNDSVDNVQAYSQIDTAYLYLWAMFSEFSRNITVELLANSYVAGAAGDPSVDGVTWSHRQYNETTWTTSGGDIVSGLSATYSGDLTADDSIYFDVTTMVDSIRAGRTFEGFRLRNTNDAYSDSYFYIDGAAQTTERPLLIVKATNAGFDGNGLQDMLTYYAWKNGTPPSLPLVFTLSKTAGQKNQFTVTTSGFDTATDTLMLRYQLGPTAPADRASGSLARVGNDTTTFHSFVVNYNVDVDTMIAGRLWIGNKVAGNNVYWVSTTDTSLVDSLADSEVNLAWVKDRYPLFTYVDFGQIEPAWYNTRAWGNMVYSGAERKALRWEGSYNNDAPYNIYSNAIVAISVEDTTYEELEQSPWLGPTDNDGYISGRTDTPYITPRHPYGFFTLKHPDSTKVFIGAGASIGFDGGNPNDHWALDWSTQTVAPDSFGVHNYTGGYESFYETQAVSMWHQNKIFVNGGNYWGSPRDRSYTLDWTDSTFANTATGGAAVYGHGLVYNPITDLVYQLLGAGNDDVRSYNPTTNTWSVLDASSDPGALTYFNFDIDTLLQQVIIQGASGDDAMWRYNIQGNVWDSIRTSGTAPTGQDYNYGCGAWDDRRNIFMISDAADEFGIRIDWSQYEGELQRGSMTEPDSGVSWQEYEGSTVKKIRTLHTPIYSELQMESASGTYLLCRQDDGFAQVINATDYSVVHTFDSNFDGIRWSPTVDTVLYYTDDGEFLASYNLIDDTRDTIYTPSFGTIDIDRSYQEFSDDGYLVALCFDSTAGGYSFGCFDLQDSLMRSIISVPSGRSPDWVQMSPLGNYIVVSYGGGEGEYYGFGCYDTTGTYQGQLAPSIAHSTIFADGENEWLVFDNASNAYQWTGEHYIVASKLPDGYDNQNSGSNYFRLMWMDNNAETSWDNNMHLSSAGSSDSTIIIMSTYSDADHEADGFWRTWEQEITAIYFSSRYDDMNVKRLVHHYSQPYKTGEDASYYAQPHATINRDGTKVWFGSNWQDLATDNIDLYEINISSWVR